jgi:hypothetical protein
LGKDWKQAGVRDPCAKESESNISAMNFLDVKTIAVHIGVDPRRAQEVTQRYDDRDLLTSA